MKKKPSVLTSNVIVRMGTVSVTLGGRKVLFPFSEEAPSVVRVEVRATLK